MAAGYRWEGADLILQVRAQPRAGRDEWAGLLDDRFRVRITAPPVDGQANARLREFLATLFGVAEKPGHAAGRRDRPRQAVAHRRAEAVAVRHRTAKHLDRLPRWSVGAGPDAQRLQSSNPL